jgi:uncharacterized protein (AIM24 family)
LYTGGTLAKRISSRRDLKVDTGCIVGFTKDVDYDMSLLAASRILFLVAKVCFTPHFAVRAVYIQSLPFSRLADRIIASAPRAGGNSRDEGVY